MILKFLLPALISVGLFYLFVIIQELPYPASRLVEDIPPQKYAQYQKQSKLVGQYAPNSVLHNATVLVKGQIQGSESVTVGQQKTVLLDKFGNIYWLKDDQELEHISYIGPGRPLGAHFAQNGDLYVCDSTKGLIQVNLVSNEITILSNQVRDLEGKFRRIVYANDLDVSSNGEVYFTSSSDIPVAYDANKKFYDTMWSYLLTMFHGKPTGFLVRYNPDTRSSQMLMDDLWYANGVALSKKEDFIVVCETVTATIYKYYLKGDRKGQSEILIDGLPGFPDGITRDPDGTFWVAILAKPLKVSMPSNKWLRGLLARIWQVVRPTPPRFGLLLNVDEDGKVQHVAMDDDGSKIYSVSGVFADDQKVYMGNLGGDFVSFVRKSDLK
eukprot:TRINITY_DN243_c1_g2_i5.p1 TRINITY_DN243_c1_g2~~TRINITY_DN243_c1_g2_i5.p1  ORF type:complete len:383 (-),score=41.80 TRINITY_DN243_c1_g2_i5:125-1273(-)